MDYSLEHPQSYLNKPISQLPTPSLIVSLPTLKRNVDRLHRDVEELGIRFRPHVKTLKVHTNQALRVFTNWTMGTNL